MTKSSQRLQRLAEFRDRLRDRDDFGRWQSAPNSLGYVVFGDTGGSFIDMAYEAGWVEQDFAWMEWHSTDEAVRLQHPGAIRSATEPQMAHILTALVRGDRFSEGLLLGAFQSGILLALSERASALVEER